MDAARKLKLRSGHISACCNGKRNRTGTYEFKFDIPNEEECLEGEEWKQVGETKAYVSSLGRLKSTQGVVSTPLPTKSGYVNVMIDNKNYQIHRLIAIAFNLPRQKGRNQVNHKDNNPSNNKLINLEWVTRSENIQYSYKTNVNRKSSAEKQSKPVLGRKLGDVHW